MAVEKVPASSSLIDVLDRILDKGIVIDAHGRLPLEGITLAGTDTLVVVTAAAELTHFDLVGTVSQSGAIGASLPRGQAGSSIGTEERAERTDTAAENAGLRRKLESLS